MGTDVEKLPNAGTYRASIGDFDVTTLNDGHLQGSFDILLGGADPGRREADGPPRICVNAFLIRRAGATWLVDAGCGTTYGPRAGFVRAELERIGVRPADVDVVLMSHLHGDHANGLLDDAKRPVYAGATLMLAEEERAFWLDDARVAAAPPPAVRSAAANRAVLAAYGSRVRPFRPGEILPGVEAVPLPGHTPGHTGFLLRSADARLLIWGDIVHVPALQLAEPDVTTAFDVDPDAARATRWGILARAAAERLLVAGMHLDFPALGHVARSGDGYRFVAVQWLRSDWDA